MPIESASKRKWKQGTAFAGAGVERRLHIRRGQIKRRVVELAGIQHRSQQRGDHRLAARALKERRYLEFVLQLLDPATAGALPPLPHSS